MPFEEGLARTIEWYLAHRYIREDIQLERAIAR